jgi:hypothetical protein
MVCESAPRLREKKEARSSTQKARGTMPPLVVDVAVHGGGLAAYYHYGLLATLAELERAAACRVRRYYTVSAGAALCACFVCFPAERHARLMRSLAEHVYAKRGAWMAHAVAEWLDRELPSDAHETCTGRLWVTYTERRARRAVCTYATRAELLAAIVASCSFPGVCAPLSCLWTTCDGFVPLTAPDCDGVQVLWGAMPSAYSMVALNLPFVWWAQAAKLAIPLGSIVRAILAGFERVGAIESAIGQSVVRAAAGAARERARRSWAANEDEAAKKLSEVQ